MTALRRLFGAFFVLAALLAVPASAQDTELPPRPDGPIYDGANIIDEAAQQQLDQRLRQYNRETGRAVIVATVPSLGGNDILTYSQDLAESWDIGGAETEESVLLLVAPEQRELRIATGRGVQGRFTDAISGRIIRNTIVPRFREGDYTGGIVAGVDQIVETLNADPATLEAIEEAEAAARANAPERNGASFGGIVFWIVMIVGFMAVFGRGKRRGRRRRYGVGSAVGDIVLWSALSSMMDGDSGGGWSGGGGGSFGGGGGFGGFGGGGGGFNGGGASGSW